MTLLNLKLETIKVGDTWRGLPDIDFDPDITSDLVEVYVTFRESEWTAVKLTLDINSGITITDPANNIFTTTPQVLDLLDGLWLISVTAVFADGTRYSQIRGTQRITR